MYIRKSLVLMSFLKGIFAFSSTLSVPDVIVLNTDDTLTQRAFIANIMSTGLARRNSIFIIVT